MWVRLITNERNLADPRFLFRKTVGENSAHEHLLTYTLRLNSQAFIGSA
jgi:hypothetical protein